MNNEENDDQFEYVDSNEHPQYVAGVFLVGVSSGAIISLTIVYIMMKMGIL